MAVLSGRIFKVQDELALVPILLADIPPLFGYAAWSGVTVTATCYVELVFVGEIPIASFSATTAGDGSFSLSVDVPNPFQGLPVSVAITMSSGVPVYRCALVPLDSIGSGKLNFWLFPYTLPSSDGITAGSISLQLANSLPAGTTLTTSAAGLDLTGINESGSSPLPSDQIHIKDLRVGITADSLPDLQAFVDVGITYANIDIDFPTSLFVSNNDVLQALQSALANAAGSLNASVLTKMEGIIEAQEHVTPAMAQQFFTQDVSTTFTNRRPMHRVSAGPNPWRAYSLDRANVSIAEDEMTDQMASQMPMAPMEHAHNFMSVPSLATQKTQSQVDLALAAAGHRAALAMPAVARLRDRTWQLESLAATTRKMVLGDEPSRSRFTATLATILNSGATSQAETASSMRRQPPQGRATTDRSQQNDYNLAAVLDVLSGISYCASESASMASSATQLAAYTDDCLSPLLAISELAAAMAGPFATRAPGTADALSSMLVSLGCTCGTCDACRHPSVLVVLPIITAV